MIKAILSAAACCVLLAGCVAVGKGRQRLLPRPGAEAGPELSECVRVSADEDPTTERHAGVCRRRPGPDRDSQGREDHRILGGRCDQRLRIKKIEVQVDTGKPGASGSVPLLRRKRTKRHSSARSSRAVPDGVHGRASSSATRSRSACSTARRTTPDRHHDGSGRLDGRLADRRRTDRWTAAGMQRESARHDAARDICATISRGTSTSRALR